MDFFQGIKEDFLYKAPLTATVFKNFSTCYQHFSPKNSQDLDQPFVYVDHFGVKFVTSVVEDSLAQGEGIFALSMAENGFVEMLALSKAS